MVSTIVSIARKILFYQDRILQAPYSLRMQQGRLLPNTYRERSSKATTINLSRRRPREVALLF
jgi:hypothetical protein